MRVAWYAQVVGVANIRPELELMVPVDVGPVIHELVLMLLLGQRAVAVAFGVEAQCVPERKQTPVGPAHTEIWHSRSVEIVQIQAGDTGVAGRVRTEPPWQDVDPVTEVAKAEVGQGAGTQRVVKASGEALIADLRAPGEVAY